MCIYLPTVICLSTVDIDYSFFLQNELYHRKPLITIEKLVPLSIFTLTTTQTSTEKAEGAFLNYFCSWCFSYRARSTIIAFLGREKVLLELDYFNKLK